MSLTLLGVQKKKKKEFVNFSTRNIENIFQSETRFARKLKEIENLMLPCHMLSVRLSARAA